MIRRDENSINIFHDKKNEAGYKRVLPGQFVIHLRSFQGGFAHSAIEGITSPAYTVFGFSEPEKHDSEYWKYVFTSKAFIRRLETVTYGIRDGRSISYDEFLTLSFAYPSKAEQTAIARYLDKLSDLITLHQRQPFLHSTPEISLTVQLIHPFYTSSWEQRKFSELVQIERGGSPRPIDDFITDAPNGLNWVKIGDAPTQGNYITKTAEKIRPEGLSKTREVHPGDLILSNSMSFGKPYIMGIDGCIHDGWLLIRNTYGVFDLTFLCHLLGTPQMLGQYRSLAAGSTVNNLNKELVGNTVVTIPSITEQRVLGDYLEQLDHLITLHQRKGKAAVTGCSNDANNSKGVYCKARDFGYKCYKKVKSQQFRCLIAVFIFFV